MLLFGPKESQPFPNNKCNNSFLHSHDRLADKVTAITSLPCSATKKNMAPCAFKVSTRA